MTTGTGPPWPIGTARAAHRCHRVVHIFSARWNRRSGRAGGRASETPAAWAEADRLRDVVAAHEGWPLAHAFAGFGHLERQYNRVAARMPAVVGSPLSVSVPHNFGGRDIDLTGHVFLVRLAGGQLSVCLSLDVHRPLSELPDALLYALEQGPGLALNVPGDETLQRGVRSLEDAVHRVMCTVRPLAKAAAAEHDLRLLLGSELHTMLFVREGDDAVQGDEPLVRRLLGRLSNESDTVRDPAILWPGELNRCADTMGAIRPGASLLAGQSEPVCRNAFVSALLLMGSASLLRDARDEAYDVLNAVNDVLKQPRHRWSARGVDPFEAEQSRLAVLTIAVAFEVESHLDIRRVVSDANLADFHHCLATALAIPRSIEATTNASARLASAVAAAGARSTTRNAFILTLMVGAIIGIATLVLDILK